MEELKGISQTVINIEVDSQSGQKFVINNTEFKRTAAERSNTERESNVTQGKKATESE